MWVLSAPEIAECCMNGGNWLPSPREQHLVWCLQMLAKYGIGGGGLVWELLIDRLRNPTALVVFGAVLTSTNVFDFARSMIRDAKEERMGAAKAIDAERSRQERREG